MFRARYLTAPLAMLFLAACAATPSPPALATLTPPAEWRVSSTAGAAVEADWWTAFHDPHLAAAVQAALAANTDLAIAEARVREAQALSVQARSLLAPSLDLTIGAQDQRRLTDIGRVVETEAAQPELRMAYEVDLWGRLRSGDAAARASLQASRYGREAVALSVAAATARAYVSLASLDAQLQIAGETLAARRTALEVIARRAEAGYLSQLDLAQARAEFEAVSQRVPALELAVRRQENALRLLTGAAPGRVERSSFDQLVVVAPSPGLPSALLERRPDIAQAQSQLIAADASLDAARAAMLPQVRLTAAVGELFAQRFDPITVWTVGGSVLAPIFDAGRREAQTSASAARRDQAALAYKRVVLNAFAETENALEGVSRLERQAKAASAQRDALQEASDRAGRLYEAGHASRLERLDAERRLFEAQLADVQVRENELANTIALYQALGGGWSLGAAEAGARD
ncbi:efflux transporter outer membrane subunit [Phenylobacterium sp.]|uniref:efflux transporter outer membrane subunit n=1 Tax=Phenylobacterium sp. TaxID=1871053 RepID=UPI0028A265BD|nr:efflux transporter outer membrane subunit [Phenylobacterium sp.]